MAKKGYHFNLEESIMKGIAELAKEDRRTTTSFVEVSLERILKESKNEKKN